AERSVYADSGPEPADEQNRLIVELRAVCAGAGQQTLGNFGERTAGMRGEFLPHPRKPQLAVLCVEHLDETVRDQREKIAGLPADRVRVEDSALEHPDRQ